MYNRMARKTETHLIIFCNIFHMSWENLVLEFEFLLKKERRVDVNSGKQTAPIGR